MANILQCLLSKYNHYKIVKQEMKNPLDASIAWQVYRRTVCRVYDKRGIIPQNFSSLRIAVSEELGNKQNNTLTDIILLYKIDFQLDHPLPAPLNQKFASTNI